ncbi:MAG TPA: DUF1206 domain-containing protein [Pyrinomonadaceae bacterium]|nr:DUF1206 domain-containing protein [Pyrinomonadaceae bacterium]
MIQTTTPLEKAKEGAADALEGAARSKWVVRLARFGYAAKGVVYVVVGVLATLAALGSGERLEGTDGALRSIARQPYGEVLLGAVAVGLVGYVVWRVVQSLADVDGKGSSWKGLAVRAGFLVSGLAYAGVALSAARIVLHVRESGYDLKRSWSGQLMAVPYGRWVMALVGIGVVGFGLFQIYKGYKAKFWRRLKLGEMPDVQHPWALLSGRVGYAARGVVFCVVGVLLVQAARHYDANEVVGLDGALQALTERAFGPVILGAVAVGLVAYGVYMFVEARYRRIGKL